MQRCSRREVGPLVSKCKPAAPPDIDLTRRSLVCSGDGGILVNTDRAHRLVYCAWKKGGQSLQQTVLSNLFHALIIDCKDVSNIKILSEIADASCLMSKDEVGPTSFTCLRVAPDPLTTTQTIVYLTSNTDVQEVEDQIEEARKGGVTGVPVIIINGKWAISGGQTRDVYLQVNYPAPPILDQSPLTHDLSSPHTTKVFEKLAYYKCLSDNTPSPEHTSKALSAKVVV